MLKRTPVNFILTFIASRTFVHGKFEKRNLFLSYSSPKEPSTCLISKHCLSEYTPRFVRFSNINFFCVIRIRTVVRGIIFNWYPIVVSAQGFYKHVKFATSAECSEHCLLCRYGTLDSKRQGRYFPSLSVMRQGVFSFGFILSEGSCTLHCAATLVPEIVYHACKILAD
jgi:hypothetical protein